MAAASQRDRQSQRRPSLAWSTLTPNHARVWLTAAGVTPSCRATSPVVCPADVSAAHQTTTKSGQKHASSAGVRRSPSSQAKTRQSHSPPAVEEHKRNAFSSPQVVSRRRCRCRDSRCRAAGRTRDVLRDQQAAGISRSRPQPPTRQAYHMAARPSATYFVAAMQQAAPRPEAETSSGRLGHTEGRHGHSSRTTPVRLAAIACGLR